MRPVRPVQQDLSIFFAFSAPAGAASVRPATPKRKSEAACIYILDLPLAQGSRDCGDERLSMIAPETFSHIENIKKRAGHLWRFL